MRKTPLRKVSSNQAKRNREYTKLRAKHLGEHPVCEVCNRQRATQIHHMGDGNGPKRGSNTNNVDTWLGVCFFCHEKIESNKGWAREMGYLA